MKRRIFVVLGLGVALALLVMGANCASPGAGPSIWTDKPDYAPEETVTIFGADFSPGPVTVTVTRPDGKMEQIAGVSANSLGSFAAAYQLDGITGTYIVNAIDSAGQTAHTAFTDGANEVYMGPQVGALNYGTPGCVSYNITVVGSGQGGHFDLRVEDLPSGATGSFDPSSVNITDSNQWPVTSNLTVCTNSTTPAGTFTIWVIESPGHGGEHSANGTLTVDPACVNYWHDVDSDGYGGGSSECLTSPPTYQYATVGGDCDDSDNTIYPGAIELCDGKDNDCDGSVPANEADGDGDGALDCSDSCPSDPLKIAPGQCGCGNLDTDTDSDGTADCIDQCPNDSNKIVPGQCGCGNLDADTDNDGTADCIDQCPNDSNKIVPGQCGCGLADTDSDGDGVADCVDGCPADASKTAPGVCGCGVIDADSDGDGAPDCVDGCPSDPNKTAPGTCGCGVSDVDSDGDGVADCNDGCPADPDKTAPGVCGCGVADADSDGDGVVDCSDLCPSDPNKVAPGICGCGVADTDSDGDGVADCNDGCPADANKTAPSVCGCGVADADSDGDSTPDCLDGCPLDPNKTAPGTCGCGVSDVDSDGDGVADCNDGCPADPGKTAPDVCGCGVVDTDTDGDTIADCIDNCPGVSNPSQADSDSDGIGDACETAEPEAVAPTEWYILMVYSGEGGKATEPTEGNYPYGGNKGFFTYFPGTVVDLVAVPDANHRFAGWTGAPDMIADVDAASTSITMNRDCIVRANFAEIPETPEVEQYNLAVSSTSGGSVTAPGEGTFTYDAGEVLDLVARADSGYQFVRWTGDVTAIANVNGASTTITMNDDYSVVANFAQIPAGQVTLSVSSSPGGSVTVPGEATFAYDKGRVVNLKAEPEEGYRFVAWIGDVDGVADVTAASTTVTMNDDYGITGTFVFGTGCFIATAAYGTPMAEEIQILRDFRDEYLITNPVGSTLVDLYYAVSPPVADFITEHPSLKPVVRAGLAPAVAMSTVVVNTSPAEKAAIVGLLVLLSVALAVWATRRRHKGSQYA
jgi:hypothetical protein